MDDWHQRFVDLAEAALECAGDLEAELNARYSENVRVHPGMARQYERDMEPVKLIRKLVLDK